ncbi:fungal specific transcription factor domain-containing protein [Stagonosporopsis vannaccii]|nr:fungal specific transcription factor domain-containing protein [Stagonosporopsis vannaccii]
MSDILAGNKRRRGSNDLDHIVGESPEADAAEARKRRAFLHTMGRQLREFGNEGVSPRDPSRNTFPSPGRQLSSRAADSAASQTPNQSQDGIVHGEDDQLPAGAAHSASKWLWRGEEVEHVLPERQRSPVAFEDLLDWSQSYFDHWHPSFPFLHAPALLDYFRELARNGGYLSDAGPPKPFYHIILRSVISIATMDRRQMMASHKSVPSTHVFHTFSDAISSLSLVLTEESSILSLQALVSVQLFLISMHRYNAASRLQGIAAHLAYQLSLHRCPVRTRRHLDKETELRKRLFWSVFCVDRYISIRLGNPSVISSDDIDVCYPQSECHGETSDDDTARDDRLDLIDYLARHADIRGSIMKNRNRAAVNRGFQDDSPALLVETEHAKWWTMVDEHLSDPDLSQSIAKPHQVTLMVLRFETILALHRSVLGNPKHNTVFNVALQRCVTASRSIINTLHKALKGFGAFDGSPGQHGYETTPLLWPSFTWAIWMSTFVIIFAAAEKQLAHKIALSLADRSIEVLQHIAQRGTNWPESCIVAIKNLIKQLKRPTDKGTNATRPSAVELRPFRADSLSFQARPSVQNQRPLTRALGPDEPNQDPSLHSVLANTASTSRIPAQASFQHAFGFANPDDYTSFDNAANQDSFTAANIHLSGSGDFLGIAQQMSDVPRPNEDINQLFSSEGISWWMEDDFRFEGIM